MKLVRSRVGPLLVTAVLSALYLAFAWANFHHWRQTGRPSGIGMILLETWVAAMVVMRRSPTIVSRARMAWVAAPVGTFALLLARPTSGGLAQLPCEALQFVGVAIALLSLGTLGRSFGLVAANRGVKTDGPYGIVRHPTYTGYVIAYLGYVAENPSLRNIALLALSTAFQLVRIGEEERVLRGDEEYRAYTRRVRFRLVPYLY
jgi:protein-S-isoprenylcysteine O-methyltransferase Ste14